MQLEVQVRIVIQCISNTGADSVIQSNAVGSAGADSDSMYF